MDAQRVMPERPMPERLMTKAWATQCALSRICGVCGESLGRPIAFLGTEQEVGRNAFHLPPMHVACARSLDGRPESELVTTAGFEFVRPSHDDADRRPRFEPNSLL
ncbi:hypothetical protein [Nocardioides pyridinolyticus]